MKTQYCDECSHARYSYDQHGFGGEFWCSKGHKPRFYMPKGYMDYDHGYKRRCVDFKLSKRVQIVEI